jgi:hypothetical protein
LSLAPGGHGGDAIIYGDYFGAALDPVDGTGWVVGEFVSSPATIATWVGQIGLTFSVVASVNQPTFNVFQTLIASGRITSPGLPGSADFYVGILRPDNSIQFFTDAGIVVGNLADLGSFRPIATAVSLATPFSVTAPNFYTHQWTAGDPRGNYVFFIAAIKAGTIARGSVTDADVVGLATGVFAFP